MAAGVVCIALLLGELLRLRLHGRQGLRAIRGPTRLSPSPLLPVLSLTLPRRLAVTSGVLLPLLPDNKVLNPFEGSTPLLEDPP